MISFRYNLDLVITTQQNKAHFSTKLQALQLRLWRKETSKRFVVGTGVRSCEETLCLIACLGSI